MSGRPVNLSNNCSKHVLAEVKHFHTDHVARVTGLDRSKSGKQKHAEQATCLEHIPPPTWTESVFAGSLPDVDANEHSDADSASAQDSGCVPDALDDVNVRETGGVLAAINNTLDRWPSAYRGGMNNDRHCNTATDNCINAVLRVAKTHGDEENKKSKKRPRGNVGFFHHVAATQASLPPKENSESLQQWRQRVTEAARDTWNVSRLVVLQRCAMGNLQLIHLTTYNNKHHVKCVGFDTTHTKSHFPSGRGQSPLICDLGVVVR